MWPSLLSYIQARPKYRLFRDNSARNDIAWRRRRAQNLSSDEIPLRDFPFLVYFPQDSIRSLELPNDVIIEQAAAEESDVQHSGALA